MVSSEVASNSCHVIATTAIIVITTITITFPFTSSPRPTSTITWCWMPQLPGPVAL